MRPSGGQLGSNRSEHGCICEVVRSLRDIAEDMAACLAAGIG
jgi:hypothetical protein